MKSLTYHFHVKRKILADFQICICVPSTTFADVLLKSHGGNLKPLIKWLRTKYLKEVEIFQPRAKIFRSSHTEVFCKKGVLKIFRKAPVLESLF